MSPATAIKRPLRLVDLELDLEVFDGPFDLLLTLILREEVDLLEVDLADVVISYIDYLESRGELDLEAATEFLVLITALLELKSRLMLPGEEIEEIELDPGEAADRAARAPARRPPLPRRRRAPAASCCATQAGYRFRSAPLPAQPAQGRAAGGHGRLRPEPPGAGDRRRCWCCRPRSTCATSRCRRSRSPSACSICASCCAAARSTSTRPSSDADRVTVAVTLFSLLELYKQGELTWAQDQPFGEIQVQPPARGRVA